MLASKSAIRRSVLESAGVPVEIAVADIDERGIEARSGLTDPREIARLLSCEKARAVSLKKPGRIVLGADQTLATVCDGNVLYDYVSTARLTMRVFSEEYLDRYLDTVGNAAMASVGGYQLEGVGAQLFERIEGDHFTVLGLPLLPLLEWLRSERLLAV